MIERDVSGKFQLARQVAQLSGVGCASPVLMRYPYWFLARMQSDASGDAAARNAAIDFVTDLRFEHFQFRGRLMEISLCLRFTELSSTVI
jgi:hypothetical protein